MNDGFGHEVPPRHAQRQLRPVSRYLVVIDAPGGPVARLFSAERVPVAEFDAGTEDVAEMIKGADSSTGASGDEWMKALAGHTAAERAAATVYVLDV